MIVNLIWTASACPGVTGYNVYRSMTEAGEYLQIAANVPQPNYTDQPDTPWGESFWYKISSIDPDGEGDLSSAIEAEAPNRPSAPTNLAVQVIDGCVGPPNSTGTGFDTGGLDVQLFN